MIETKLLQEFIPNGSYSFGATQSYSSDVFGFRTGPNVSVLEIRYAEQYNVMIQGELRVSSDFDCWQLLWRFRQLDIPDIVKLMMAEVRQAGMEQGKKKLRDDLKELLFPERYV
jgi:hypothetical protein